MRRIDSENLGERQVLPHITELSEVVVHDLPEASADN
jgi:hypothetical protein